MLGFVPIAMKISQGSYQLHKASTSETVCLPQKSLHHRRTQPRLVPVVDPHSLLNFRRLVGSRVAVDSELIQSNETCWSLELPGEDLQGLQVIHLNFATT